MRPLRSPFTCISLLVIIGLLVILGAPAAQARSVPPGVRVLARNKINVGEVSPDGRWFAYWYRGKLNLYSIPRRRVVRVLATWRTGCRTNCRRAAQCLAWSPDSRRLAYINAAGLWIRHIRRGRARRYDAVAPDDFAFTEQGGLVYLKGSTYAPTLWRAGQPRRRLHLPRGNYRVFGHLQPRKRRTGTSRAARRPPGRPHYLLIGRTHSWHSGRRHMGDFWVTDLNTGRSRRIYRASQRTMYIGSQPVLAPSQDRVCYRGMGIRCIDLRTGQDRVVYRGRGGTGGSWSHGGARPFSPSGQRLAFRVGRARLMVHDFTTGKTRTVIQPWRHWAYAFGDEHHIISYDLSHGGPALTRIHWKTGRIAHLIGPGSDYNQPAFVPGRLDVLFANRDRGGTEDLVRIDVRRRFRRPVRPTRPGRPIRPVPVSHRIGGSAATTFRPADRMAARWTAVPLPKLGCPAGARLVGTPPPMGYDLSCKLPDGTPHGPAIEWHANGTLRGRRSFQRGYLQGRQVNWHDSGHQDSVSYFRAGREHGLRINYNLNGRLRSKGHYVRGKQEGHWVSFHDNGRRSGKGSYRGGLRHGPWTHWHDNGRKAQQGSYRRSRKIGRWLVWYTSGQLKEDKMMRAGKRNGPLKRWHKTGKLWIQTVYRNDVTWGPWKSWADNGQLVAQGEYRRFLRWGFWREWHRNGRPYLAGRLDSRGKQGLWKLWHKTGKLHHEGHFRDGRRIGLWKIYYPTGQRWAHRRYVNGRREGRVTTWYKNGQPSESGMARSGLNEGLWVTYHANGRRKSVGHYVNHYREGRWTFWHPNGRRAATGPYRKNKRHGTWQKWYPTGRLRLRADYALGRRHGRWESFHTSGRRKARGRFKQGRCDGPWVGWSADGATRRQGVCRSGHVVKGQWVAP